MIIYSSMIISMRLDCGWRLCVCVFLFFIFYFLFFEKRSITWDVVCQWIPYIVHGTHYLFDTKISIEIALFSGSRALFLGLTTSFFNKIFIKNRFHGTIHIFKNYFTTVFLIFNFQFSAK